VYVDSEIVPSLLTVPVSVSSSVDVGIFEADSISVPQYDCALLFTCSNVMLYAFPYVVGVPHASLPSTVIGAAVITLTVEYT
jgi:hypothetical protein